MRKIYSSHKKYIWKECIERIKIATMEECIDNVKIIINALEYKVLEQAPKATENTVYLTVKILTLMQKGM